MLGGVSALFGRQSLDVGAPRQRAVLALLLMNPRRVVSLDDIVHRVWGSSPPDRATATLQSYVSRLRKKLAAARGVSDGDSILRYRSPGYMLAVDDQQVDACRFTAAVREGQRLLSKGDFEAARQRFGVALAMWRGAPYADLADYDFARDESARLVQLQMAAVEGRAEAGLALGLHGTVVQELDHEVRTNPLRERLIGQFMRALYWSGRQADALAMYERTRSRLAEDLGVGVSRELQDLHRDILRQELTPTVPTVPAATTVPAASPDPAEPAGPAMPAMPAAPGALSAGAAAVRGPGRNADTGSPAGAALRGAAGERRAGDLILMRCAEPGRPAGRAPFAGRAEELTRLAGAARAARQGQGQITLVLGEPGIGKTRLLTEFGRTVAPDCDVLWASCFEGDETPPYWPWTQLLRRLATVRPEAFARSAARFDSLIGPLMPGCPARPRAGAGNTPEEEPGAPFRTYDAVCQIVLEMAAERPLVIFLEDLHWADAPSLSLLRLLASGLHGAPVLVVATCRESDSELNDELRRTLGLLLREPLVHTIELGGLQPAAVIELMRATEAGHRLPGSAAELRARTGGNPFLLTQLLRNATAEQQRPAVPLAVREVVRQRLDSLGEGAADVLRVCAVAGEAVTAGLLAAVLPAGTPVGRHLEAALGSGLLREVPRASGTYECAPPLVREALCDGLGAMERARVHGRVAHALQVQAQAHAQAQARRAAREVS
ncbi:BTAD domain-containing putative transcriptional regulator [Streptomyces sp. NPDC026206]|uniref:BTAD domain-containing putative transcriptional regulator n=1 Tax=Streptomyces sp. NPDC026206 TaxID=3157089 RepID=UPI0033E66858